MPSNVENILNAILTGDGSGIQKPASRVEELLFEIYEQGGGGGDSVIGGIKLTIDSNYVMIATLVDKDGEEYGVSDDIDLPLEEMVVDAEYDPQTQKIKLELKNGNYVEFSVAELVSGLQTELNDTDNKLDPTYIAYDESHRAVSDTEKSTWDAKQNAISDLETIRSGAAAGATAVQPLAMQTALATKQDSLSETQLAAVNSGINSTKVAQIETNKTNILYGLNTGVKNICNPDTWILGYYLKPEDGSLIPYPGDNGITSDFIPVDYSSEDYYYISGLQNDGNNLYNVIHAFNASKQFLGRTDGTLDTTRNVYTSSFTGGTPVGTGDIAYIRITQYGTSGHVTNIDTSLVMVCTGHAKEQSPSYQPYALPNYDLTVREAEDRNNMLLLEKMNGAKNYIDSKIKSQTITTGGANITVTANPDKSFVISGTTGSSDVFIGICEETDFVLPAGDYVLSGLLSGAASGLYLYMAQGSRYAHITNGTYPTAEFSINSDQAYTVAIHLEPNKSYSTPQKIYPMICDKSAWDNGLTQYMPYALPNTDLTRLEAEDRASLAEVVDSGAKNLWNVTLERYKADNNDGTWNGNVYTNGFITYTVNSDLTVTAHRNGSTQTGTPRFYFSKMINKSSFSGCVLATCPKGGSSTTYFVKAEDYNSDYANLGEDYGDGVILKQATGNPYTIYASVSSEYTGGDITFKPMVCTKAAWNVSQKYVPYRPNWDLVGTLFPTSYTAPVVNSDISSKLSILSGGYAKAGNLVTVNIRLSVTDTISAGSALFTGLPEPKTTAALSYGSAVVPVTNMCVYAQVSPNVMFMSIDTQGTIRLAGTPVPSDITTGIYILSATYLSA